MQDPSEEQKGKATVVNLEDLGKTSGDCEGKDAKNCCLAIIDECIKMAIQLSKCHYITLCFNISAVYIALGLLISLQPPFFPSEAEKMGATPAEYGFVFGIANLSLFIFSPVFGKYGPRIGPKTCFNLGAVLQGVSGFLFAFLPYLNTTASFIGLSYFLRFLEGLGMSKKASKVA